MSSNITRAVVRQVLVLLAIATVPAALTVLFDVKWKLPAEFREVNALKLQARATSLTWVDVRSPERFAQAHIPGAIPFEENSPDSALESIRSVWSPEKQTVVYGEGPGSDRALRVARLLKKELHTRDVVLLEGGWASWHGPKQGTE